MSPVERGLTRETLTAIGVINGTSMGAIDVSLVTSDGHDAVTFGAGASYPIATGRAARSRR